MIMWRSVITARRGHVEDTISWLRQWKDDYGSDSRVKGFRLFSSYSGNSATVITETEFENMAVWESFYNEMEEATDFSNWYEITAGIDHDFWVIEEDG